MRRAPVLVLLLALLGAGCATPTAPAPADKAAFDAHEPFTFSFTSPACVETDVIFLRDAAELQKILPDGFRAADASALTGTELPTGKGAVLVANVVCEETTIGPVRESAINILVHAPVVNGSREPALFDFYETLRTMETDPQAEPFAALAWDMARGNVTATLSGTSAAGSVTENGTEAYAFTDVVATQGPTLAGIGRFWHVLPTGIAYIDYEIASTQLMGRAECTIAQGSALAEVAGTTTCSPTDSAGMALTPYALVWSLVNLPGAQAG